MQNQAHYFGDPSVQNPTDDDIQRIQSTFDTVKDHHHEQGYSPLLPVACFAWIRPIIASTVRWLRPKKGSSQTDGILNNKSRFSRRDRILELNMHLKMFLGHSWRKLGAHLFLLTLPGDGRGKLVECRLKQVNQGKDACKWSEQKGKSTFYFCYNTSSVHAMFRDTIKEAWGHRSINEDRKQCGVLVCYQQANSSILQL